MIAMSPSDAELIRPVTPFTPAKEHFGEVGGRTADGLLSVTGATSVGKLGAGLVGRTISTGRTIPLGLSERFAMEEVKANPLGKTPPRIPSMSDTKNNPLARDGWVKRTQNVNGVEIHYVEHVKTGKTVDFKFWD